MSDFKERLRIEKEELEVKLTKLTAFNESLRVNEIDPFQKSILSIQEGAMYTYHECLKQRLLKL